MLKVVSSQDEVGQHNKGLQGKTCLRTGVVQEFPVGCLLKWYMKAFSLGKRGDAFVFNFQKHFFYLLMLLQLWSNSRKVWHFVFLQVVCGRGQTVWILWKKKDLKMPFGGHEVWLRNNQVFNNNKKSNPETLWQLWILWYLSISLRVSGLPQALV